ncbi:DUF6124 family protein [Pseudomonas sp. RHF3.3-3]|uniref:DUF6124 family protein n=1 Tax=Pseudomonas sp. RHF3.3-3 TaxID=3396624 RepID=UPI003A86AA21
MKKAIPHAPESDRLLSRCNPQRCSQPASRWPPLFTVVPDIDTRSLLCHASETLASLNVMTTDLASELEGSHRSVVLAVQQLTELGELLVNRALNNLEPPAGLSEAVVENPC